MIDRATEYAKRVVAGEIIAGKLHKLACERHLNDLQRANTVEFPYIWDVKKSQRIIDYAEQLTIIEGAEPKQLKLLDCQAFDLGVTFGWIKAKNKKRRFRRRYKSVARQNGKTLENGIMGTYIAGFCNYQFGKLFTTATKKRQSRLAWEEMAKFIRGDEDLQELFQIKDYKSVIIATETNCTIEALSRESGLDDGFRSIFASIDELHQHRDNQIYKTIYNGTRSLDETLVSMITTRGEHLSSFCKEMDDYCINVLNRVAAAEDFFIDIYSLDDNDDIWEPRNWIKSNPYLCSTMDGKDTIARDAQTAKDMGGFEMRDFCIKSLNLWVQNTEDIFIHVEKWQKCGSNRTLEDFTGRDCWVGLDLSSGGDLTTIALEIPTDAEKYYLYSHSFMPKGRMDEHIKTDIAPYDIWENNGLITVTGGKTDYKNDYSFIIEYLKNLEEQYELKIKGIGIDPHNADGILGQLEKFGCPVLVIRQNAATLNDATEEIQLLCKSEKLEYNIGNELLTWSFLNAKIVKNSMGEKKVDKEPRARAKRIDPVDACINAHTILQKQKIEQIVNVETEMEKYLKIMGWKK